MKIRELRRKIEMKRWCQDHPDIDLYQDRTGCASAGVAVMVAVVLLLVGCKTKYVPVEVVRTDTTYITQHRLDSIYLHDSTYIHERGDTVLVEKWHTAWRERVRIDTLIQHRHDSVPVPYPVEVVKEVPAPLTWWQKVRIGFANVALFATVLLLVVAFIKNKIK